MAVVAVTLDTQLRCKICASPARSAVDALIARWKSRDVTKDELFAGMLELGIENPTLDNVKGHTGTSAKPKHVKFVDQDEAAADEKAAEELLEAVAAGVQERIASGGQVDADAVLDIIVQYGMAELEMKVMSGKAPGITIDQILKAVGEKTKRKHNAAQQELLGALTGGIGQVFEKALGPGPAAIEQGVVEAEVVSVEDA